MDLYKHHQRVWKILYFILRPIIKHKFNADFEEIKVDGPIVLISNHVTTWDPLLLALALRNKQIYYVASEHIFRLGFISKIIEWLVGPIARRKGASASDTTANCLKHLHAGHSVCIFGEGEQSWDGLSKTVIKGTGRLVKESNATLVTYKIIGAYFSLPRWASKVRKGKVFGRVAGIYTKDDLKDKDVDEINEIMNKDIFVDVWNDPLLKNIEYKSNLKAEKLERVLYLCPNCLKTNGLISSGNHLRCNCGLDIEVKDDYYFSSNSPFLNIAEFESWQKKQIRDFNFIKENDELFFHEDGATLIEVLENHDKKFILEGRLSINQDNLYFEDKVFPLLDISKMAMTRFSVLLFTYNNHYYQVKIEKEVNLRKYLEIWKKAHNKEW